MITDDTREVRIVDELSEHVRQKRAANDAEIGDLQKEIAELKAAWQQAAIDRGKSFERVVRERDEARDKVASCEACVRRLYSVCSELLKLENACGYVCAHSLDELEKVLDSIPEHL